MCRDLKANKSKMKFGFLYITSSPRHETVSRCFQNPEPGAWTQASQEPPAGFSVLPGRKTLGPMKGEGSSAWLDRNPDWILVLEDRPGLSRPEAKQQTNKQTNRKTETNEVRNNYREKQTKGEFLWGKNRRYFTR